MVEEKIKFIDLFAGIGGFHYALHQLGCECVFASELDESARVTYERNYSRISPDLFANNLFNDDIRKISPAEIPDFDILCAGFPCQPFSQAGQKKGFADGKNSERGNLFFNIVDIIEAKRPKAFFLENVRGIVNHDNGRTFKTIQNILENELGYSFYFQIVKATDYGLPQHRPRAFMIGFRDEGTLKGFSFPDKTPLKFNMSDVFGGECSRDIGFTLRVGGAGSNINDRRNWDSYLVDGEVVRIQPEHGLKMQGFPDDFLLPNSKREAMKQLGNSVAVDAVRACAESLIHHLKVLDNRNGKENIMATRRNKGSKPTLLNASGSNTNFVYEIKNFNDSLMAETNAINTRTKIKDRISNIISKGGSLEFSSIEAETMQYNLSVLDRDLPFIVSKMLLNFYLNGRNKLSDNLENLYKSPEYNMHNLIDFQGSKIKVKRLLLSILLGLFSEKKGDYIIKKDLLEDCLFNIIKFDTPSTTRHRFASVYKERDGKFYFKLNLQLIY